MKKILFAILLLTCSCNHRLPCKGTDEQIEKCEERNDRQQQLRLLRQIRYNQIFPQ